MIAFSLSDLFFFHRPGRLQNLRVRELGGAEEKRQGQNQEPEEVEAKRQVSERERDFIVRRVYRNKAKILITLTHFSPCNQNTGAGLKLSLIKKGVGIFYTYIININSRC